MDYARYTVDDFLNDAQFRQWVLNGTPADDQFWATVMREYPQQRAVIRQAREFLLTLHQQVEADFPSDSRIEALYGRIRDDIHTPIIRPLWQRPVWRVAAATVLLVGAGWWMVGQQSNLFSRQPQATASVSSTLEEVINNTSTVLAVSLPDGSRVTLEPRTRLRYSRSFAGAKREVYLTGEAFFDVQKDPARPFFVYTNTLTTRVLGTSFRIRAYEQDQQVTVMVKTGRVSVFSTANVQQPDPETSGVVLTPNQQVVVAKDDVRFTRSLVAKPTPILTPAELERLTFDDAPLPDILRAIERAYGVEILFDESVLAECRLTTSLGNETLFEKLDILCEAVGATYKLVDAQVLIDSKGCN